MDEDAWDFYLTKVDDNLGSIFVNLGLEKRAPVAGHDRIIGLRIVMNHPRPDGLSSADEFDTLRAIEEALTNEIVSAGNIVYVGRATHAGVRDLHYYTGATALAERALRRAMATFPTYKFELESRSDPEWRIYREYLLPSPHDRQRIANRGVYSVLKDNGDQLVLPREVDHWAYFPSASARSEFLERAAALGYAVRDTTESSNLMDGSKYCARIYRVDVPDNDFDSVTLELFELAAASGGEYDGWECPVEKPPEASN